MMMLAPSRFLLVVVALLLAAALPGDVHGGIADPVVIEFGDLIVTRTEVDKRFEVAVRLLARRQGISLADQDPSVIAALREQYLDKYASELVFLKEADRRQLAISDAQVDQAIGELFSDEDKAKEFLDGALLRAVVRDELAVGLLTEVILEEIVVPPGDVITMHHDVQDSLAAAEEFCVRHIQLDSVAVANSIRAQLEQGADFSALAVQHSNDTASASAGGDIGCFERNHSTAQSEFEEAVFAAVEGQLVGPVESQLGYHLLVVYEVKAPHTPTLNEAYSQIEHELALEQLPERLHALVAGSGIDVYPDTFRVSAD